MSVFHRHRWAIIAITATQPRAFKTEGLMSANEVERLGLGVTTFVLRCEDLDCHEVETREALGGLTRLDPTFATLLEVPR